MTVPAITFSGSAICGSAAIQREDVRSYAAVCRAGQEGSAWGKPPKRRVPVAAELPRGAAAPAGAAGTGTFLIPLRVVPCLAAELLTSGLRATMSVTFRSLALAICRREGPGRRWEAG